MVRLILIAASVLCAVPFAALASDQPDGGTVTIKLGEDVGRLCYRAAVKGVPSGRAFRKCERAIEAYQGHPRNLAASLTNRGTLHYLAGRYAEAAGDFTRALEADGDRAVILTNRGLAYEHLAQREPSWEPRARADYERALAIIPDFPVARRRLSELDKPARERTPLPSRVTA